LTHFSDLALSQPILDAIADEGYDTPTPIQAKAIPPVLEGHDLLGCAQTGTGKTAAFALPILDRLHRAPIDKSRRGRTLPRVLVLAPTRELATQIDDSFDTYGRHTALRSTAIFGGVSQFHQVKALRAGVDILIATPGRLLDLMEQRHVDLREVEVLVLDEADRMLDMGFIQPIRQITAKVPPKRQTLLFSATMPKEIMHLADSLLTNPVKVAVAPVASLTPLVEQSVYMTTREGKLPLMEHLLSQRGVDRALVFTRTKHGADRLMRKLNRSGASALAIHGNKSQHQRQRALESFRSGASRVLVATDVAARGLDVDGITHVFNFELPNEPETYVHRIGRTGRAGATGVAISLCDQSERGYLRDIERLTGKKIDAQKSPAELDVMNPDQEGVEPAPAEDRPKKSGRRRPEQGGGQGRRKPRNPGRKQASGGKPQSPTRKVSKKTRRSRDGGPAPKNEGGAPRRRRSRRGGRRQSGV